MFIAALDIGGTKMAACIADASGPLLRVTQATQRSGPLRCLRHPK
jgi:predicted NBD/HSP70 family sugar kinase